MRLRACGPSNSVDCYDCLSTISLDTEVAFTELLLNQDG